MQAKAVEALAQWQKLVAAYSSRAPSPWLFHSVRNGTKALTRRAALLEIKEAAVAVGLASPEWSRHTCCGTPLPRICTQVGLT